MRKKFLILTSVVIVFAAAGWNFNQNRNETVLADVALANVEALASESSEEFTAATGCIACWENHNCRVGHTVYTYAHPKD
jgi:hypothetical protein